MFMIRVLAIAFSLLATGLTPAFAQDLASTSIDQKINALVAPVTDAVVAVVFYSIPVYGTNLPLVLVWLIVGALVFTVYMGFVNLRGFTHALRIVRGDYEDPRDAGEVSHFQALAAALSGTVGLGNIAGVAIAISLGGPGATFWMILAGFLGMSAKFVECTLGVKYRVVHEDGSISGGPMYYLSRGLALRGMPRLGKFLAAFFAIMCIGGSFGGGNMFQVNQAFQQIEAATGGPDSIFYNQGWIFGILMAGLVAIVIIGGIKSIARVTDKLVPFMCILYVLAALVVLFGHLSNIPTALGLIFTEAFSPTAIEGGFVGVLIQGFRRAAFSNEAGIGSSAIAHSAVRTNEPVTEGFVALLEPFIDTIIVCTMTALVIIVTGVYLNPGNDGIALTSAAFETVIPGAQYFLAVAVTLFAFSTMITWSYYGIKCWTYLFGHSTAKETLYKAIFCIFVVIGSAMTLVKVTDFSDSMIFAMAFPNILGLYFLAPIVKRELTSYVKRVRSGEIQARRSKAQG